MGDGVQTDKRNKCINGNSYRQRGSGTDHDAIKITKSGNLVATPRSDDVHRYFVVFSQAHKV